MYLFLPSLITSVETQLMFNEATKIKYKISYDEYYTERQVKSDKIVQVDTGSAQQDSSPNYLIFAHQTQNRKVIPDKKIKNAIFDNLDLQNCYVEIDGQRYPRDSLFIIYEENEYFDQY